MTVTQFPSDADGDALRRVAEGGSDMSSPMAIEFAVAVSDQESGEATADAAGSAGFETMVSYDDESDEWTCYCRIEMVATYERVVEVQKELQRLAAPHGGQVAGWETAGNVA